MTSDRAAALLEWYRASDRGIPWRGDSDPYRVLVGEVMAQQTQAERVADHYRRFIDRFPSVESLAAASLTEVLQLWSGLGYNSRAKRLRLAARLIAEQGWPPDLQVLPGVGPYTAAAVDCFAFGAERAIVDTNVRRVLGRWRGSVLEGDGQEEADRLLVRPAADWNQAVMDLGARVCAGRAPKCRECPVSEWCAGPDAYRPPQRQSPYEGSPRQARAAILLYLANHGPATPRALAAATGLSAVQVRTTAPALISEDLVVDRAGQLSVAD